MQVGFRIRLLLTILFLNLGQFDVDLLQGIALMVRIQLCRLLFLFASFLLVLRQLDIHDAPMMCPILFGGFPLFQALFFLDLRQLEIVRIPQ